MKISVIIPIYNCEKYIGQAVESVLNQPYKNIDIVLVNDGSMDRSPDICDRLASETGRIHVIHQKNSGVSAARNAGIEYAVSAGCDYLGFLDADDIWCKNAITPEIMDDELISAGSPLIAFGAVSANECLSRFHVSPKYTKRIAVGPDCIWTVSGTFAANLYSTKLVIKHSLRFPYGLKYSEDKIFKMQNVYLSHKVLFLPKYLYIYRNNPVSAMHKVENSIPAIKYYLPIIDGWIKSDHFINSHLDNTQNPIKAGHALAGIYLMDMSADHFKQWRSAKELRKVLYDHPHFHLLKDMRPQDVSPAQYKNSRLLLNHPFIFECKYRLIGAVRFLARQAIRIPLMRRIYEKRTYPLRSIENINS